MIHRSNVVRSLLALAFVAGSALTAQAEQTCSKPPYSTSKSGHVVTIDVDWMKLVNCLNNEKGKALGDRITEHINEDNLVDIHITNFNFINYTMSYKVEETGVESYVMFNLSSSGVRSWQSDQRPGEP